MKILNVCDERLADLALQKRALSGRIARQRGELATELTRLKGPIHAFDAAQSAGALLREHGPAIAMALAPVLYLARRPLMGGVGLAARLAQKATRWWSLWKLGSKVVSAMPHPSPQRRYAR